MKVMLREYSLRFYLFLCVQTSLSSQTEAEMQHLRSRDI